MIPGNNPNNERFPGRNPTSVDSRAPARPAVSSGRRRLLLGGAIFLLASMVAGGLLAAKILAPFKHVVMREGKGDAHKAQIVIREQYNALQIIPQTGLSGHPSAGAAMASAQPAPTPGAPAAVPRPAAPSVSHAPGPQSAAAPGRMPGVPLPTVPPAPLAPRLVAKTNGKAAGRLAATKQHPVRSPREALHVATQPLHPPVITAQAVASGSALPSTPLVHQVPTGALAHYRTSTAHQTLHLASIPVLSPYRPAGQAHRATVPPRKATAHPAARVALAPAHAATLSHHVQPAPPHATFVARATASVPQVPVRGSKGMAKHPVKREESGVALLPVDTGARRKAAASRQVHPPARHIRPIRPVLAERGDAELPRHRHYADRLPADDGDEMDDDGPPPGYYAPPPRYYAPPPRYYGPPVYPGYMYRPPPPYYPGW